MVIVISDHADISQRSRIVGEEFNAEGDSSLPQEEARRNMRRLVVVASGGRPLRCGGAGRSVKWS